MIPMTCVRCGKPLSVFPSHQKRGHRFCSNKCSAVTRWRTLPERLASQYEPVTESGCWIWMGAVGNDGYGRITHNKRSLRAHRVSWEIHHGTAIPDGLSALHRCDNPLCIRPDHLFLGTQADNVRDREQKGRGSFGKKTKVILENNNAQV